MDENNPLIIIVLDDFISKTMWFSIAVLNYQRVLHIRGCFDTQGLIKRILHHSTVDSEGASFVNTTQVFCGIIYPLVN